MKTKALSFLLACALCGAALAGSQSLDELRRNFDYDVKAPLDAKLTLLYERDGVSTYDLAYPGPKGGTVTGFLVAPPGNGPFAGVVFGHWGPGNRTEFLPEAVLYAQAGAVSVLIDYPWNRPAPFRVHQGRGLKEPEQDRDSWIHAVVDLRRAIDLLAARKDVDPARIGYVGHSYGAQWGAILSAIDKRLKAVVLVGGAPSTEAMLIEGDDPDFGDVRKSATPEELENYLVINRPFDAIRYVPYAAPTPLLFQFARHEQTFKEPAMKRYFAAASEPKEIRWYDTGHDLNDVAVLGDRVAWLGPKIGLRPVRPLIEKRLR